MQRPELAQLKERGYKFSDPFEVVEIFENKVSEYAGAKYGVAVDCCTHAVELCLRYLGATGKIRVPKRTYVSIPMTVLKLNCEIEWIDLAWKRRYPLEPFPVIDASLDFRADSHVDGTFTCLSFHMKKTLPIGRGGMILTNDGKAAEWLRKASYDGRTRGTLWKEDAIETLGYHYYMTPEDAARGLLLFDSGSFQDCTGSDLDYPDLSLLKVFQGNNGSN